MTVLLYVYRIIKQSNNWMWFAPETVGRSSTGLGQKKSFISVHYCRISGTLKKMAECLGRVPSCHWWTVTTAFSCVYNRSFVYNFCTTKMYSFVLSRISPVTVYVILAFFFFFLQEWIVHPLITFLPVVDNFNTKTERFWTQISDIVSDGSPRNVKRWWSQGIPDVRNS